MADLIASNVVNLATVSDADYDQAFQLALSPSGEFYDLTDGVLRMTVRRRVTDANAFMVLDSEGSDGANGLEITDPVNGIFTLTMRRERFVSMPPGNYVHSLVFDRPDGLRSEVWNGIISHALGPTH